MVCLIGDQWIRPVNRGVAGYNRLARFYRPLEYGLFANQLQRARVALLDALPRVRRARVLGDGDGRFLQALCQSQPHAQIESYDFSPVMLQHQQRRVERVAHRADVDFCCQDARTLEAGAADRDLLVCNFFLDCFTAQELQRLLPQWLSGLRPGGLLYVSDFVPVASGWWKYKSALDQSLMHLFFRWQTDLANRRLVDWAGELEGQPLSLQHSAGGLMPMVTCRIYRYGDGAS